MIEVFFEGNFVSRHRLKQKAFEKAYSLIEKQGFKSLSGLDFRNTKNTKDYGLFGEFRDWFYEPLFFFEKEEAFLSPESYEVEIN